MTKEGVEVGALQNQLRATEAHVQRLLEVLRGVGHANTSKAADPFPRWCFCCPPWDGPHLPSCIAAVAELERGR